MRVKNGLHVVWARDVALHHGDGASQRLDVVNPRERLIVGRVASHQDEMPRAALHHPLRNDESERTQAAGDEIARVAAEADTRLRLGQHDLADVVCLRHPAERVGSVGQVERRAGQSRQPAIRDVGDERREHAGDDLRIALARRREVDHVIFDVRPGGRDALRLPDAKLSKLEEAAATAPAPTGWRESNRR